MGRHRPPEEREAAQNQARLRLAEIRATGDELEPHELAVELVRRGVQQVDAAEVLGLTRQQVSRYASGWRPRRRRRTDAERRTEDPKVAAAVVDHRRTCAEVGAEYGLSRVAVGRIVAAVRPDWINPRTRATLRRREVASFADLPAGERDGRIVALVGKHVPVVKVARAAGISRQRVYQIAAGGGKEERARRRTAKSQERRDRLDAEKHARREERAQRNQAIVEEVRRGRTCTAVAAERGLSISTVSEIAKRGGVDVRPGQPRKRKSKFIDETP